MMTNENYFQILNQVDLKGKIEKKNGLSYVSWSYAWQEIKKRYPNSTYTIYENNDGLFYHNDGRTAWVKTGVTVNNIEHIEYLPIMDFRNKSIPLENVTSMDVNKAIQRSLTKACARHGLGLYVYAGEDLPESDTTPQTSVKPIPSKPIKEQVKELREENEKSLEDLMNECETKEQAHEIYTKFREEIRNTPRLMNKLNELQRRLEQ